MANDDPVMQVVRETAQAVQDAAEKMAGARKRNAKVAAAGLKVMEEAGKAYGVNASATLLVLSQCERKLRRMARETLSGEYEQVTVSQLRGPTLKFNGKQLCQTVWETRGEPTLSVVLELWETPAGALVPVYSAAPADRSGYDDTRAAVIEASGDIEAMRFAVMDFFDWNERARSMVEDIGWDLAREVE